MKKPFLFAISLALFASTALFTSCNNDDDDGPSVPTQNIVELAQDNDDLQSLVAALTAADLVSVLEGTGPFTVFAPTDEAFERFLAANNFDNLEDVPADLLEQVLLYHVLGGRVPSDDITNPLYATTASPTGFGSTASPVNADIYVAKESGTVQVNNGPEVTMADVEATNGVIHIVDEVIAPSTVVTFATADPNFSTLVAALTRTDLTTDFVDVLTGDGPFTVFAPTNQAFQDLLDSNDDWDELADIPADLLDTVLKYHVTDAGNVRSTALMDGMTVNTLAGESFEIDLGDPSAPKITDGSGGSSNIIFTDAQSFNGVVHVIDRVILPAI